jgi:hypothetical protein
MRAVCGRFPVALAYRGYGFARFWLFVARQGAMRRLRDEAQTLCFVVFFPRQGAFHRFFQPL